MIEPVDCLKLGISTANSNNSFVRIVHVTMSGTLRQLLFHKLITLSKLHLQNDSDIPLGSVVFNTAAA